MYAGHVLLLAALFWLVSEVDAGNSFVLPALAELVLVVQKRKFLYDVVHDQVDVYLRLACRMLSEGLAKLDHLTDVKPLIRVQFQHPCDHALQFRRVLIA